MSVKFITSRIHTGSTLSLEEAAKKAQQGQVRSIDDILADLKNVQSSTPEIKTASAEKPMTKTASTEQPITAKVEEEIEVVALKEEKEEKEEKKEKKGKEKAKCASTNATLKVAKKLDFRGWSAESIVKAWDDHKDINGCIASVKGQVNAPEVYCGLLQVASEEATKMIKAASAEEKKQVVASKGFEKLAKMSKEQIQLLREYFTPLYGEKYVDSLLGDY